MKRGGTCLFACLAIVLAGCGSSDDEPSTPSACLDGAEAYVEALADAPDEVLVGGETPISDCLPDGQPAGEQSDVGEAMVAAATELNDQARKAPQGEVPVRLGYLVGAVQAAAESSSGIHEDLALRVESAATFIPSDDLLPAGFQQRYEEGIAAGMTGG
jgi:hypothetical protein